MSSFKKRPQHCLIAVRKNDKNNLCPHFKTRIITSKSTPCNESLKWKQDWFRFNKLSYDEVVCKNVMKDGHKEVSHKHLKARMGGYQNATTSSCRSNSGHLRQSKGPNQVEVFRSDNPRATVTRKDANINTNRIKTNAVVRSIVDIKSGRVTEKNDGQKDLPINKKREIINKASDFNSYNKFSPLYVSQGVKNTSHLDNNDNSNVERDCGVIGVGRHTDLCGSRTAKVSVTVRPTDPNAPALSRSAGQYMANNHDKYGIALNFKHKNVEVMTKAKESPLFQLWDQQNCGKFGFVPLTEQTLPTHTKEGPVFKDSIELHHTVKASKNFNFLEARCPVNSQLKSKNWESMLQGYWDTQVVQLIRYGFPLSFNNATKLGKFKTNHSTAVDFKEHVHNYLQEEVGFKAMLGPFDEPPIPDLHISPLLTRDKPGSDNRQVIVDLSFPQGESVNAGVVGEAYLGSQFCLTLPSIDYITNKVCLLGKGSLLYKIDISHAFRHVPIDPGDYNLLGLYCDSYFIDKNLPFGYRHGSAIFQRLSDAIRYIMKQKGYLVTNYIDDILGQATPSQAQKSFDTLYKLLGDLGLDISHKKLIYPTTKAVCLGVKIDTENFTISVPEEKLQDSQITCRQWKGRNHCNKRDLQSLLGKLLYITKCVRSSRPFLNRMLQVLRQADKHTKVVLTEEFHRDLCWFQKFLPLFNGVAFFSHNKIHSHIELDASLQGLGAVCDDEVCAMILPLGFRDYQIVQLEMINIYLALKIWGHKWTGKCVVIHCDNQAVVMVLNSGRTRDTALATITRNRAMLVAIKDIELRVVHIPGKHNVIADNLSRVAISPQYTHNLLTLIPNRKWLQPPIETLNLDLSI